jgi:hypothetical protein
LKFNYSFPILFLFITILFSSCTDEPSSLGIELIGSENISAKIFDTAVDSAQQSSSFFKKVIALGSTDWILIGRYQDIEASTLMKFVFGLPDSLKEDLIDGNINVLDSWVILTNRYIYTDSMATMNFTVHKVNSSWSSSSFTVDSLANLNYEPEDASSQFTISDTLYTFHLDGALPLGWMKYTADNTVESNYGIYLDPTDASNKVIGFQAFTSISSEAAKLFVVIEKPGVYVDTINGFISTDISIVDRPNLPALPAGLISVQSSVAINSKLTFNLDQIPVSLVINKAELFITPDTISSVKGSSFSNSLRVTYLSDADSLNTQGNPIFLTFKENKYTGDITSFVRNWVSTKENNGILIEAGSPTAGLELFALKGSDYFEFSERPRLRITYTVK